MHQSKWLKTISVCLIIIGGIQFLNFGNFLYSLYQIPDVSENVRNLLVSKSWPGMIFQFLIGSWFLICGIGLLHLKKWAWWPTIILSIYGLISKIFEIYYIRIYAEAAEHYYLIPIVVLKFAFWLSVLFFLVKQKRRDSDS